MVETERVADLVYHRRVTELAGCELQVGRIVGVEPHIASLGVLEAVETIKREVSPGRRRRIRHGEAVAEADVTDIRIERHVVQLLESNVGHLGPACERRNCRIPLRYGERGEAVERLIVEID